MIRITLFRRLAVLLGACTFAVSGLASAQDAAAARWSVPDGGVLFWDRAPDLRWSDGNGIASAERLVGRVHPVLFAGELDPGRTRLVPPPWSLQAIGPWLAWDLAPWDRPGPVAHTWPRIEPFGVVSFRGEAEPPADGWQTIRGRLSRAAVPDADGVDPDWLRFERHYHGEELTGTLQVRRRLDPQPGRIVEFEWSIEAKFTTSPGGVRTPGQLQGGERWTLRATLPPDFPAGAHGSAFAEQVDQGIARAQAFLGAELVRYENQLVQGPQGRGNITGPSMHAAILLALARSGLRAGDPDADELLAALLEREQTQPHGFALVLLALGELHAPRNERVLRLRGASPSTRTLPGPLRERMAQLVRGLLVARSTGQGDAAEGEERLAWSFMPGARGFQTRATWLAVRALDEAAACGVDVAETVWVGAARHLLDHQLIDGNEVAVQLRREPGWSGPGGGTGALRARPGGWPGDPRPHPGTCDGAATAGSMAALLVCRRRLPASRVPEDLDAALQRGWAWLAVHGSPRYCPAPLAVHRQLRSDHVLAMGFLLEESGVRWLDGRDRYFEQAIVLLQDQREDGVVLSTVEDTPAALGFWRGTGLSGPRTPARDR